MDMKTLRLETREGDRMLCVPTEAAGNPEHHLCQECTITRFHGDRVMVKFDEDVEGAGWDSAPEVALDPRELRIL